MTDDPKVVRHNASAVACASVVEVASGDGGDVATVPFGDPSPLEPATAGRGAVPASAIGTATTAATAAAAEAEVPIITARRRLAARRMTTGARLGTSPKL